MFRQQRGDRPALWGVRRDGPDIFLFVLQTVSNHTTRKHRLHQLRTPIVPPNSARRPSLPRSHAVDTLPVNVRPLVTAITSLMSGDTHTTNEETCTGRVIKTKPVNKAFWLTYVKRRDEESEHRRTRKVMKDMCIHHEWINRKVVLERFWALLDR